MDWAEINGKTFLISRVLSRNRNAWARLKGDTIIISLPSRWQKAEREKIAARLEKRAIKAIERGRWSTSPPGKVGFRDGQRLTAMGREFEIAFVPSKKFGSRLAGSTIKVGIVEGRHDKHSIASRLARKRIIEVLMPELLARVDKLNQDHFGSTITKVTVRDNSSRWGSCSPSGSISLNFRLLFMPQDILDYVIVHELAHTRYRSHGPRFWALVEKAMPAHREHRKWLRENGWKVPEAENGRPEVECGTPESGGGKPDAGDGFDEPY